MKKAALLLAVVLAAFCFCAPAMAEAPFHIGIVTGTVSQSEDDLRGAELMIQKYGDVSDGGSSTSPIPTTSCPRWRRQSRR